MLWTSTDFINARIDQLAGVCNRTLHIVQFLNDPVIDSFVRQKLLIAERLQVSVQLHRIYDHSESAALLWLSRLIHETPEDGYIIQLPLPSGWDRAAFLEQIPVIGDIDLLSHSAYRQWKDSVMQSFVIPPIVYAVSTALQQAHMTDLSEKSIVVCGSGLLVGQPVQDWLTQSHIPYHVIDIYTEATERSAVLSGTDIIISGTGAPWSITPNQIRDNVFLIDCGTSSDAGTLRGDIHPDCAQKAAFMTATPRGIGPLTVLGVFENLIM